ncbi:MAG: hypothetical protein ACJ8CB_35430 [Ktedonobacteraceae bacterium]
MEAITKSGRSLRSERMRRGMGVGERVLVAGVLVDEDEHATSKDSINGVSAWMISDVFIGDIDIGSSLP